MSATCGECEADLYYKSDGGFGCAHCELDALEIAADALAKAVEAMWANRVWESTSAPEWKTTAAALAEYRKARGAL